jgi:hypothetical protein
MLLADGMHAPMNDTISSWLERDHRRLGALLRGAIEGDAAAYAEFRAGLLRHIGIEEKILLRELAAVRAEPIAVAPQLHLDHAALAALLVPSPTPALLERVRAVLELHDPLEEGPGGLYAIADETLAARRTELIARFEAAPAPPLAKHFDGPRAHAAIDELLARASAGRAP